MSKSGASMTRPVEKLQVLTMSTSLIKRVKIQRKFMNPFKMVILSSGMKMILSNTRNSESTDFLT